MSERRILLLGCGNRRMRWDGEPWDGELTTLDIDPVCKPDIEFDLNLIGQERAELPFDHNTFDEVHAYHVLEHFGTQGDFRGFFRDFSEFWRILKPEGKLYGIVPDHLNTWAWGDPGHRRVINNGSLVFLDQRQYTDQVGKTALCDYRRFYVADFDIACRQFEAGTALLFTLTTVKPSRISA